MKPAILQLIPNLEAGGAERTAIDMAHAAHEAGFVALVASEGGRLENELTAGGGELIRMPMSRKSPLTIWRNAHRLAALIAARNVRLVHARSRAPAWSGLAAARWSNIPFVTTYHGVYSGRTALKRWYNSVMVRGDAVIANSYFTAERIAKTYPHAHIVAIPRGLGERTFDPTLVSDGGARCWPATRKGEMGMRTSWSALQPLPASPTAYVLLDMSKIWPQHIAPPISSSPPQRSRNRSVA